MKHYNMITPNFSGDTMLTKNLQIFCYSNIDFDVITATQLKTTQQKMLDVTFRLFGTHKMSYLMQYSIKKSFIEIYHKIDCNNRKLLQSTQQPVLVVTSRHF